MIYEVAPVILFTDWRCILYRKLGYPDRGVAVAGCHCDRHTRADNRAQIQKAGLDICPHVLMHISVSIHLCCGGLGET
jgi:hypothetical protein